MENIFHLISVTPFFSMQVKLTGHPEFFVSDENFVPVTLKDPAAPSVPEMETNDFLWPVELFTLMIKDRKDIRDKTLLLAQWVKRIKTYLAQQKVLHDLEKAEQLKPSRPARGQDMEELQGHLRRKGDVSTDEEEISSVEGGDFSEASEFEPTPNDELSWDDEEEETEETLLQKLASRGNPSSTGPAMPPVDELIRMVARGGPPMKALLSRFPNLPQSPEFKKILQLKKRKAVKEADALLREKTRKKIKTAHDPTPILGEALEGPDVVKPKKQSVKDIEEGRVKNKLEEIEMKSRIRIPDPRHANLTQDTFKVDITRAIQPPRGKLKREPNLSFVQALKVKIKNAPYAIVAPLCMQVEGLKDPADFDMNKHTGGRYKYHTIGGNHSRIAFTDLLNSRSKAEKANVRYSSALQFRDCVLFADNLSNEECRILGEAHNTDNDFRSKMSFMDRLREARNSYFREDGVTPAFESQADWRRAFLLGIGEPLTKMKGYNPTFVTALWNSELLEKLDEVDRMLSNNQLKGQSGGGKKPAKVTGDKFTSIGATYVTALNGLSDEKIMAHLMKLINGEWTLKEMHASAMAEKIRDRIVDAWNTLTGSTSEDELKQKFGAPTVEQSFKNFNSMFSKDKKQPPKAFEQMVLGAVEKFNSREAVRAREEARSAENKRDADEEDGEEADQEQELPAAGYVHESTEEINGKKTINKIELYSDRVFLPESEFRGSAVAPGNDLGFPIDSTTKVTICKADVTDHTSCKYMVGNFKLILLDPPYGLTQETWDSRWTEEQFRTAVQNVRDTNTAESFTLVSFCCAEQISGFLNALSNFNSPALNVGVTHGVWHKVGHHTTGTTGRKLKRENIFLPFSTG